MRSFVTPFWRGRTIKSETFFGNRMCDFSANFCTTVVTIRAGQKGGTKSPYWARESVDLSPISAPLWWRHFRLSLCVSLSFSVSLFHFLSLSLTLSLSLSLTHTHTHTHTQTYAHTHTLRTLCTIYQALLRLVKWVLRVDRVFMSWKNDKSTDSSATFRSLLTVSAGW